MQSLIKRISKLLKLDISYLAKGGLWTTLSFVVGTLGSVVTMIAFGNLLPRETYGTYNYLLSLGASLSFLTLSGIGPAVMRAVARGYESIVPQALRLSFKYNSLAVLTILAVASYYGVKGNELFATSLFLLAIAYPVTEVFHLYKQILTARRRFDLLTKITSIITLVGALVTVIALLLTDNILVLIGIYTTMSIIPNVLAYHYITRGMSRSLPDQVQVREMKRTALHFTGAGAIGVIASYIDKVLLFQVAGPGALAVYGFAIAGPERLKSLVKNWGSVALPKLTRRSLEQIHDAVYNRIFLSLVLGTGLFLIYLLIAPILFNIFLPKYLDAVPYSQALALTLVTTPISVYIGSVFSSQNMLRAIYALNFGNHLSRIILYVIMVYLWQTWGLIIASVTSSLINALMSIAIWEIEYRRLKTKNE